jgi:hypothetical protein
MIRSFAAWVGVLAATAAAASGQEWAKRMFAHT